MTYHLSIYVSFGVNLQIAINLQITSALKQKMTILKNTILCLESIFLAWVIILKFSYVCFVQEKISGSIGDIPMK